MQCVIELSYGRRRRIHGCDLCAAVIVVCVFAAALFSGSALILSLCAADGCCWCIKRASAPAAAGCRSFNNYYEPPEGNFWPDNFTGVLSMKKVKWKIAWYLCMCVLAHTIQPPLVCGYIGGNVRIKWNYRHYWMAFYSIKTTGW